MTPIGISYPGLSCSLILQWHSSLSPILGSWNKYILADYVLCKVLRFASCSLRLSCSCALSFYQNPIVSIVASCKPLCLINVIFISAWASFHFPLPICQLHFHVWSGRRRWKTSSTDTISLQTPRSSNSHDKYMPAFLPQRPHADTLYTTYIVLTCFCFLKLCNTSWLCLSSFCRACANLLSIVAILV